jgi:PAS domain S-box-containing protein
LIKHFNSRNRSSNVTITRGVLKIFLPVFVLAVSVTVAILLVSDSIEMMTFRSDEQHTVAIQTANLNSDILQAYSDLVILAQGKAVKRLWDDTGRPLPEILADLTEDYLNVSMYRELYDQIRLLDENGKEIARVNFNNGLPISVHQKDLQNKKDRYYFKDAFKLNRGEVFISPFDLNIEYGKIEQPLKPMLRFATPVFDLRGLKRGIILLNYFGAKLFERLTDKDHSKEKRTMLLNREGYWLFGPSSDDEWGFMYEDRKDRTFAKTYPDAWQRIKSQDSCQFVTSQGMFTSKTVYPLIVGKKSIMGSDKHYYWKAVSFVSSKVLYSARNNRHIIAMPVLGFLLIVWLLGVWRVVKANNLRRQAEEELLKYQIHLEELVEERTTRLKESEAKFRGFVEFSSDWIWEVNSDGIYTYASPQVEILLGYKPEELVGKTPLDLMSPKEARRMAAIFKDLVKDGKPIISVENTKLHKNGRHIILETSGVPIFDETGKITGYSGVAQDISERRRQETILATQLRLIELAGVESVGDLLQTFLNETEKLTGSEISFYHFVDADEKSLHLKSWSTNTLENLCSLELKGTQYPIDKAGVWVDCVREGRPVVHNDYASLPHRKGFPKGHAPVVRELVVPVYFENRMVAILGLGNKKTDYLDEDIQIASDLAKMAWEIVGRKLAEEERDNLEAQLRQSQKMEAIGQLAGGIAHDFNNLLQAILGYGDLVMLSIEIDNFIRPSIEQILKAGHRAKILVQQLLAFSRRQVLEMKDVNLNDIITDLMKMVRRMIGEHISLKVQSTHNLGIVHADPGQIEQILMNLCVNARDAMENGGTITIKTENLRIDESFCENNSWAKPGRYVLLNVSDTGCGMTDDTIGKIFDPFFTTKGVKEGTGLGLSTVYGLVKQHRGMIHVDSEVGKGTTFKIYLPLVERSATVVAEKVKSSATGGTETILLAEDNEMVRDLSQKFLEDVGYTVLIAGDGEDALRVFDDHADKIDLALLDVMMPKLGGRAVYEHIREARPEIRILFSSGYSEDSIHTNFVLDVGLDLIQKPYLRDDLLHRVREVLSI